MARRAKPPVPAPPSPAVPVHEELEAVLSCRGAEREARLLASERLAEVVSRMPPEELFFTLKELGEDDVPAVLACARPAQVQFLLDLDLWRKDRLRRDRILPWLRRLAECGDAALARWLHGLDPATWELLLGSVATVRVKDEESDPFQEAEARAPFTLDGVYYVSAPEEAEGLLRTSLILLRERDAQQYYRLVEALSHPADAEFEELCFEEKGRRLAERGFPTWEEAYGVYARLPAERFSELPLRPTPEAGGDPPAAPLYPVAEPGVAPELLTRALRRVAGTAAEKALRADLAYVTNKVLVADGLDVDRLDSFRKALSRVAAYVSVGLELLCGPDDEAAARVLSERWVEHLFRAGWTRIREASHHARRFLDKGWPGGRMERLLFLDSPLPEVLDALLRRHPLCRAGDGESPELREFKSLREVAEADRAVEKADFLGRFLLSVIDFRLQDLNDAALRLDAENLKGSTVFLTAVLNGALGREFRFAPVEREAAREGLAKLWGPEDTPHRVKAELGDAAFRWASAVGRSSEREEAYLREFIAEALRLLEEEFGHLPAGEAPDPRYTRGLWIV